MYRTRASIPVFLAKKQKQAHRNICMQKENKAPFQSFMVGNG